MEVEDMEAFVEEFVEGSEVDLDYEFDASQFHDFIRGETNSEAREAERWFETAANHPPSPLVMKHLNKSISSNSKGAKKVKSTSKKQDVTPGSVVSQSTKNHKGREEKVKTKSDRKPSQERSSTLMKPTASHLAKLIRESHSHPHLYRRSHNSSTHMNESKLQNPHAFDNAATKRQKLEIGYLWKIAQLRHENLLLHKINMKVRTGSGNLANFKAKVTIPKEPELVTQQRALNRRNNSETSDHAEPRTGPFKARSLNKQMLQAPSILPSKKATRKLPKFKVFHLRTTERAMQHSSPNNLNMKSSASASHCGAADFKRSKCDIPLKTRPRPLNNSKVFPTQEDIGEIKDVNQAKSSVESRILTNKDRLSQNPPTELFDKLSLISELEGTVPRPKGHLPIKVSKENSPDCFQPEFWKCVGKPNQCGSARGIPGIAIQPNMNRSMGIR